MFFEGVRFCEEEYFKEFRFYHFFPIMLSISLHFVFMEIIGGKNFNEHLYQQVLVVHIHRIFRAGKGFRVVW